MTTQKDPEAVQILKLAKDILSRDGSWCKGNYFRDESGKNDISTKVFQVAKDKEVKLESGEKVCAVGAVYLATSKIKGQPVIPMPCGWDTATRYLNEHTPSHHVAAGKRATIISYNDSADTTLPDVISVFDKAIEAICKKSKTDQLRKKKSNGH